MNVLLTGGAGFIGSNLTRYWLAAHPEDRVTVFDLLTYAGRRESLVDLEANSRYRFVRGDVANPEDVREALRGSDLVLHLAAETHNDRAISDPTPFVRTNVVGTATLLEACRTLDIPRAHFVSTDEVFGSLELGEPRRFDEDSPYCPRGPYSASKAAADHLVRAWHTTYGLPVTLSNCSNNFGPYQFPEKLIPLAITNLLRKERVPLYGDGRNVRDWIYVEDHCAALDLIARRGRPGATYLVSAETELSNVELLERLVRLVGSTSDQIERVTDRPGHDRRYALDPRRVREELGWSPGHPFDAALQATVDWYRAHRAWWEPLRASAVGKAEA
ncbi:MAG TPA: dTDP-glucose 4,6-dehydratase [Thermoplasmata archaeon]|nr:dTDP-glucose 4,6-dehydratase [Thermoplasmata archaeon]